MAKGDTWRRLLGPASFNKQPKPDPPPWDLGKIPHPFFNTPEEMREFEHKSKAYHDELDRIKKEYLLREWWLFLGVDNSDDALWRLGELLGYEAFQLPAQKAGRPRNDFGTEIQLCIKVYDKINSGKAKSVKAALLLLDPKLNQNQGKLRALEKTVSRIHAAYKKTRSRLYRNPEN